MDWTQDKHKKQQTVTRLALCAVIAVALYAAVIKFGDKLPLPERCMPWLEQNKVQAIALFAAALFGLSLAVLPLASGTEASSPEGCDPCAGYERVGDLP